MRARYRGKRTALPRVGGAFPGNGDEPRAKIGYDRAAEIAKESAKTGRTVREIAREKKVLPEKELESALDPIKMTESGGKE